MNGGKGREDVRDTNRESVGVIALCKPEEVLEDRRVKLIKTLGNGKALHFATGSANLAQAMPLSKLLPYLLYIKSLISDPAGKP